MESKVAYLIGMNEMIKKVKIAESQLKSLKVTLEELKKNDLNN